MFADLPIEPRVNYYQEYQKPKTVKLLLKDMCQDIAERGSASQYSHLYDAIYEHIENNLENYLPEESYDD